MSDRRAATNRAPQTNSARLPGIVTARTWGERQRPGATRLAAGEEAVAELQRAVEVSDRGPVLVGALAAALARAGRPSEARALLAEIDEASRRRYVSPAAFINALRRVGRARAGIPVAGAGVPGADQSDDLHQ